MERHYTSIMLIIILFWNDIGESDIAECDIATVHDEDVCSRSSSYSDFSSELSGIIYLDGSQLTIGEKEYFTEEIQNSEKQFSILCAGSASVGKSTLLRNLMGVNQFSTESHLEYLLKSDTSKISEKNFFKNGIQVTILEVSELNDIDDAGSLQEIKKKCAGVDLFLYCIDSTESKATRLLDDNLTNLLGMKLWKNAVVVLTKANVVVDGLRAREHGPGVDVEKLLRQKISDCKLRVHEELRKSGLKKYIVKGVPVLPAGNLSLSLPGHPFWLGKIFEKSLYQINYRAIIAYLQFAFLQMQFQNSYDDTHESNYSGPQLFFW